jgi:hypothetical protein
MSAKDPNINIVIIEKNRNNNKENKDVCDGKEEKLKQTKRVCIATVYL